MTPTSTSNNFKKWFLEVFSLNVYLLVGYPNTITELLFFLYSQS